MSSPFSNFERLFSSITLDEENKTFFFNKTGRIMKPNYSQTQMFFGNFHFVSNNMKKMIFNDRFMEKDFCALKGVTIISVSGTDSLVKEILL